MTLAFLQSPVQFSSVPLACLQSRYWKLGSGNAFSSGRAPSHDSDASGARVRRRGEPLLRSDDGAACMFRSALDALKVVEDLKKRGIALHLLDLRGDISGNGLSKLFLTIAAAFAEAERDRIRERIEQVRSDQKAPGRYLDGKVPLASTRRGRRAGPSRSRAKSHWGNDRFTRSREAAQGHSKTVTAKGRRLSHEGVAGVLRATDRRKAFNFRPNCLRPKADPNAAAALQELMGGRYVTLNNYLFQSF